MKCLRYEVIAVGVDRQGRMASATNYNEGHCTNEPGKCGCKHAEIALLEKMPKPHKVFLTYSPCVNCAEALISAGVREVQYLNPYRILDGLEMIIAAGIKVTRTYSNSRSGAPPTLERE